MTVGQDSETKSKQSASMERKKRRGREEGKDLRSHDDGQKRQRIERADPVAIAMKELGETATELAISKTEQAVKILQNYYGSRLDEEELLLAMEVFEVQTMGELFVGMKEGALRDKWLERQIEKKKAM